MIYSEYDLLKAMDMIYNYLNYKPMDDCMRNRDRLEHLLLIFKTVVMNTTQSVIHLLKCIAS